jgi:hypothetical protein
MSRDADVRKMAVESRFQFRLQVSETAIGTYRRLGARTRTVLFTTGPRNVNKQSILLSIVIGPAVFRLMPRAFAGGRAPLISVMLALGVVRGLRRLPRVVLFFVGRLGNRSEL